MQNEYFLYYFIMNTQPDLLLYIFLDARLGFKGANNFRMIMIAINYIGGSFNTVCPHFLKYDSPGQ